MIIRKKIFPYFLAFAIASAAGLTVSSAHASNAGAFIGGVFATKLLGAVTDNSRAQQQQAQAAQSQAYSAPAQHAPAAQASPEARIKQLDKLAAGGYITPAEYKAKKQAIIDSM